MTLSPSTESGGVRAEVATVFRGGGRRFFTRKAAERAEAKAAIRKRCECCDGDYETPPYVCTYHNDPVRLQRTIHLLVVMFVRPASATPTPGARDV